MSFRVTNRDWARCMRPGSTGSGRSSPSLKPSERAMTLKAMAPTRAGVVMGKERLVPPPAATSKATPLAAMKFEQQTTATSDLALGLVNGSTGETSAVVILVGGAYLALRGMLNWRIPAAILLTVALFTGIVHQLAPQEYPTPMFMLAAGGLFFGAIFMATDMVTAPLTQTGVVLFGVLIGALVVIIRLWGGLPEGVQYSILLANACVPLIDRVIQPRAYGTARGREAS